VLQVPTSREVQRGVEMAEIEEILENHEKRINALEIAESVKKGTEVDLNNQP